MLLERANGKKVTVDSSYLAFSDSRLDSVFLTKRRTVSKQQATLMNVRQRLLKRNYSELKSVGLENEL
jgi:hypothetical protein